jgi:hypothetical protein
MGGSGSPLTVGEVEVTATVHTVVLKLVSGLKIPAGKTNGSNSNGGPLNISSASRRRSCRVSSLTGIGEDVGDVLNTGLEFCTPAPETVVVIVVVAAAVVVVEVVGVAGSVGVAGGVDVGVVGGVGVGVDVGVVEGVVVGDDSVGVGVVGTTGGLALAFAPLFLYAA